MDYKKEINYLNNMEAQFRVIETILLDAKKRGLKTITLKDYGIFKETTTKDGKRDVGKTSF